MQKSDYIHSAIESQIYRDVSLYKVIKVKGDRHYAIHFDGSVSAIIKLNGINSNSFSENDYQQLLNGLQYCFEDYSKNVTVTFTSIRTSADYNQSNLETIPRFLRARAENYNKLVDDCKLFKNEFYLTLFVSPEKKESGRSLIKKIYKDITGRSSEEKKENLNEAFNEIESRIQELSLAIDIMLPQLISSNCVPKLINSKTEYYNLFQKFFRPEKSKYEYIEVDDSKKDESPRQTLFSGVRAETKDSYFHLDNYLHRVYSLDRPPKAKETVFGNTLEILTSVPYEYIFSISFHVLPTKESVNLLKWKTFEKEVAAGKNKGAIVADKTLNKEVRRINEAFDQFADGEAVGVYFSANFVIKVKEEIMFKEMRQKDISKDEYIRQLDTSLLKTVFPKFGRSEWVCEPSTGWYVFLKTVPGFGNMNAGVLKSTFATSQSVCYMLPLYTSSRPVEFNGVNFFIDERGNSFNFDLHDSSLPAWNYNISGATGSGKSVLVNAILSMQYAEAANKKPPVVCIIDVGGERGSYTKLLKLVDGEYINLSGARKPSIQVLELNPGDAKPTPKKVNELIALLKGSGCDYTEQEIRSELMSFYQNLSETGLNNISDRDYNDMFFESFKINCNKELKDAFTLRAGNCEPGINGMNIIMAFLEIVLSSNYKNLDGFEAFSQDEVSYFLLETYRRLEDRFPYMSDFLNTLIAEYDKSKNEILLTLISKVRAWTKEGVNYFFDQDTNIDLSKDTILVDLKGLKNEPHLQACYTMYFSELFSRKMYSTRGRKKLVVRDEAWSVVQNEKARAYFIEDMRTARKNGFATISVSQFPTDFLYPSESDGRAILGNTQVFIIGKITESVLPTVARELRIPDHIANNLLKYGNIKKLQPDGSMKTVYSKFLIKIDQEYYSINNVLSSFENILFSSSEEDNLVIDYYMKVAKNFSNLEDCLWHIANKNHVGDQGLYKYLEASGNTNKAREVKGDK